ncbi:hypothetical protein QBC44DRAFT_361032 [Cladorrhinum sp. PSN332]|nr:hypothetical protein QBC44DRAFT_361032 [Cladorrhinum sp. PSN332]
MADDATAEESPSAGPQEITELFRPFFDAFCQSSDAFDLDCLYRFLNNGSRPALTPGFETSQLENAFQHFLGTATQPHLLHFLEFLTANIERAAPCPILPSHFELGERLLLTEKLEALWKKNFSVLTLEESDEWKPFTNLQVAALMVVNLDILRRAAWGGNRFSDLMAALCVIPVLTKTLLTSPKRKGHDGRLDRANYVCTFTDVAHTGRCRIVPYTSTNKTQEELEILGQQMRIASSVLFGDSGETCVGERLTQAEDLFASKLAINDKEVWNKINMSLQLVVWWDHCRFGLKYVDATACTPEDNKPAGTIKVKLQWHWMPTKVNDVEPLGRARPEFLVAFVEANGDPTAFGDEGFIAEARPRSGRLIRTGDIFYTYVAGEHVEKMKLALEIQWVLVRLAVIAGGLTVVKQASSDGLDFLTKNGSFPGSLHVANAAIFGDAGVGGVSEGKEGDIKGKGKKCSVM